MGATVQQGKSSAQLRRAAERARTATSRRDEIIRAEYAEGRSLRDLAGDAGVSHTAIQRIVNISPE